MKRILILGVNGFIGHHLTRRLLADGRWRVQGYDLRDDRIRPHLAHPRFSFLRGDLTRQPRAVERLVAGADVVLPLAAIAIPKIYIRDPLRVFALDFEANLPVVRMCATHRARLVFASTSEVYGMCRDRVFSEDTSSLVLGPVRYHRWIYACSKQLLDRVIWAYGLQRHLRFTIIRPFNWIGPGLDTMEHAKEGSARVVTQFIANLRLNRPIRLVDGGRQRRSFIDVEDAAEALVRVLENRAGRCDGEIINIGNPANECSIRELARRLRRLYALHPLRGGRPVPPIVVAPSSRYYGRGYQDMAVRVPSIVKAQRLLRWRPRVSLDDSLRRTMDAFLGEHR